MLARCRKAPPASRQTRGSLWPSGAGRDDGRAGVASSRWPAGLLIFAARDAQGGCVQSSSQRGLSDGVQGAGRPGADRHPSGKNASCWVFSIARAPRKDWLSVRKRACVRVRGRPRKLWRRVRTLRPDDRSGPGLASVRGRDRPAPETRGSKHVDQTQRHAACAAERCVAAR